ncbi:MAG: NAD(P)-dependent oxidoreductase [Candidatus Binatia bacterium]
MPDQRPRVGFIGLGRMGRPMACNVLRAGFPLVVHSRSPGPVEALVARGARAAATPADVARAADVVLTCLPAPADVEAVVTSALAAARPGQTFIDHSTIDPDTVRRIADRAAAHGAIFLDAPVSGGVGGAEAGTLTVMVGGPPAAVEPCRPVLRAVGERVFHLGPTGSGSIAKLCNQLLIGVGFAAVAEAMVLGTRAGLDPRALYDVLSVSSGRSRALEQAGPAILSADFGAEFTIDLAHKDLECVTRMAKSLRVRVLLAALAQQLYEEARAAGLGQADQAAVVVPLERLAGVQVAKPVEGDG